MSKKRDFLGQIQIKKSVPRKQIKNNSQNRKNFIKNTIKREGFGMKKNIQLLLLIKKQTVTLIAQTGTRPQATLEFRMNK